MYGYKYNVPEIRSTEGFPIEIREKRVPEYQSKRKLLLLFSD